MYIKMLIFIQYVPGTENLKIKLVNTLNSLITSLFSFSNQQTCKGYSILCFGSVYWDSARSSLVLLLQETNVKYKNTISYSSFQNSLFCLLMIIFSLWMISFFLSFYLLLLHLKSFQCNLTLRSLKQSTSISAKWGMTEVFKSVKYI